KRSVATWVTSIMIDARVIPKTRFAERTLSEGRVQRGTFINAAGGLIPGRPANKPPPKAFDYIRDRLTKQGNGYNQFNVPTLQRLASRLNLLDVLDAQWDRHARNVFLGVTPGKPKQPIG